jgi:hypothetical protein
MTGFGRRPPIDPTYRNLIHAGQMQLPAIRQQKCGSRSEPWEYFSIAPHSQYGLLPTTTSGRNDQSHRRFYKSQTFHGPDAQLY